MNSVRGHIHERHGVEVAVVIGDVTTDRRGEALPHEGKPMTTPKTVRHSTLYRNQQPATSIGDAH